MIGKAVGNYLTKETGIQIVFESAIVPNWNEGKISLRNVSLKLLPEGMEIGGAYLENGLHNYTMFDLSVESIDISLSFLRWSNGQGLVKDADIKGVRGVIDRRHVTFDPDSRDYLIPRTGTPSDFNLSGLTLEDLLITVYDINGFRPYDISIFSADLGTFRQNYIFYDILCANSMVGIFDGSLFSLHRGQTVPHNVKELQYSKRMAHLRVDGLNIDYLNANARGPFSWIRSGKIDFDVFFRIPHVSEPPPMRQFVIDMVNQIDEIITQNRNINESNRKTPNITWKQRLESFDFDEIHKNGNECD